MTFRQLCTSLFVMLALAAQAVAAELGQIDRVIRKEPAYHNQPRYCLLVLGYQAKTRIWLVIDGDDLYIDRDGSGDLTQTGKLVHSDKSENSIGWKAGPIQAGSLVYTDLTIAKSRVTPEIARVLKSWRDILKTDPGDPWDYTISITVKPAQKGLRAITQSAAGDLSGALRFASRPQEAPIVHFNGPLSVALKEQLVNNELIVGQGFELRAGIGTPGLGKGTFAFMDYYEVPQDIHPRIDLELPAAKSSDSPLRLACVLKYRC